MNSPSFKKPWLWQPSGPTKPRAQPKTRGSKAFCINGKRWPKKLGASGPSRSLQRSVIEAAKVSSDAKAKTTELETALAALTERADATDAKNTELQSKLEEATLGAVAAKVASDALISALTSQGQALQDKLDASDTKIAELQSTLNEQKEALKIRRPSSRPKARPSPMPVPAPPRAKPGLPSWKKTSPSPRPCAQIWYRSAMSSSPRRNRLRATTKPWASSWKSPIRSWRLPAA